MSKRRHKSRRDNTTENRRRQMQQQRQTQQQAQQPQYNGPFGINPAQLLSMFGNIDMNQINNMLQNINRDGIDFNNFNLGMLQNLMGNNGGRTDNVNSFNNINNDNNETVINDEIKLPSVSNNPIEELRELIREKWKETRVLIPKEKWEHYQNEIAYELDIVEKTNMANYFLMDYKIVKIAREKYKGVLTKTGRRKCSFFLY